MKVVIHDRTAELAAPLRTYTEKRLSKLSRHFERVLEADVLFTENGRHSQEPERAVKITVRMDGRKTPLLTAHEKGRDLQAVLDLALDKVDRQIVKLKDRIVDRHKNRTPARLAATEEEGPTAPIQDEPERVRQRVRPESVAEAAKALDANGHLFHVFLNEDTGEVNVIYRRADDSLAVIEPVVT